MRVLVTGSKGFIGKNLLVKLSEDKRTEVLQFARGDSYETLASLVSKTDFIVHLAGENRPSNVEDFAKTNTGLTKCLCESIRATGKNIPLILASSTQAELDNPYGLSKRAAEDVAQQFSNETGSPVVIYRLPGVFGKWCRPNYNSVVATFCHNIARDLPIQINNPTTLLRLNYIDDVIDEFLSAIDTITDGVRWAEVTPEYTLSLGDLAAQIEAFKNTRKNLIIEHVGTDLVRALYSTYVSYLPLKSFVYDLPRYNDERGCFVEMLKTIDSGQFSFFTAHPGVTRGSHYHHSKTEKFLVIRGKARFRFRHIITDEKHELFTSGEQPQIVDTIPGWAHDITNVGDEEMVVMLWANEIFDRNHPDTIACKV